MTARRIFHFKSQWRWLINHKEEANIIGFESIPSRTTLSRRYKSLCEVLQSFIKSKAEWAEGLDDVFNSDTLFEDKNLFKANGNVWHAKDQKKGVIPNKLKDIDKDASWDKSHYHGWVYGYGLHATVNPSGFPFLASVYTAKVKESYVLDEKFSQLQRISPNSLVLMMDIQVSKE